MCVSSYFSFQNVPSFATQYMQLFQMHQTLNSMISMQFQKIITSTEITSKIQIMHRPLLDRGTQHTVFLSSVAAVWHKL